MIFANPFRKNLQRILTSDFGQRCLDKDSSNDNKVGDVHEGIDLSACIGKELRSPCNGTVLYVGTDTNSTGGKYVIIKTNYLGYAHPNHDTAYSIYITYMHMDTVKVSVGASVGVNTLIGTSGDSEKTSSGASYDAHLHYGVFLGSTLHTNGYVNPNTDLLDPWMFSPDILDKEEVDI